MALVSQALVRIVGDETPAVNALRRFNAQAEASERKFNQDFGRVHQMAGRVALALGAVGVAAGALGVKAVRSAAEAEAVWKRLDATLGNTGTNFGAVRGEIERTADQLQKYTRFGDEQTAAVLQRLVSITGDYRKSLAATELVMDVSIGTQMDLDAAAKLVGKGMMGVTSEFTRYGIVIRDGESATEALSRRFGGLAREDGKTLQAQLERITNAVDDLFEAFGGALAGDDAANSIGGIADAIKALADTIERNKDGIHEFFATLGRNLTEGPLNWRMGAEAGEGLRGLIGQGVNALTRGRGEGGLFSNAGVAPPLDTDAALLNAVYGRVGRNPPPASRPVVDTPVGSGLPARPGRIVIADPFLRGAEGLGTGVTDAALPGLSVGARAAAGGQSLEEILAERNGRRWRGDRAFIGDQSGTGPVDRISAQQWLAAGGQAANLFGGVMTGRTSALGALGGGAGIAGGLVGGPAGIALQGVSMAAGLVEGIFGNKRDREEEQYRAHLRALREARREQMTVIRVTLPAGSGKPDHAYIESLAEAMLEVQGTNAAGVQWQFTREDD